MPELDVNSLEIQELAAVIQSAPQMSAVVAEASASPEFTGNFADRDPVLPEQVADNTLHVQPPTPMA